MVYHQNPVLKYFKLASIACCLHLVHNSSSFRLKANNRVCDCDQNIVRTFSANTELQCARWCMNIPECSTLAINTNNHVCLMLSRILSGSPFVGGVEWVIYETDHVDCPISDTQMYIRELNTCLWYTSQGFYTVYESIDICAESGGHLVKIDSYMKQSLVQNLIGENVKRAYIQGNDTMDEGVWRFDDGSLMTYFNWYIGMPRGRANLNFLIIRRLYDFQWQDHDIVQKNEGISVICEKNIG